MNGWETTRKFILELIKTDLIVVAIVGIIILLNHLLSS